jgi:chromosome segregation ATPase
MLHAVYEQMTKAERRKVDRLVADYLEATPDARSHQLLLEYDDLDEALRRNEAHSIVGTVEPELPRSLERHYARYFEDRADIVGQFQQYQHVFDELDATLTRLEGEAQALEAQLSSLEGELNGANAEAERLFGEIESLRAQGRVEESNNLVDAQNAAVNRANSLVDQYNALVDQYNAKVAELNAAGLVGQQIYQSLTPIEA